MDYSLIIASVCILIEKRLKTGVTYRALEHKVGFSYRHIREVFKEHANISLAKYVLKRKLSNAAFEMIHSDRSLTDISLDYGFEQYGSFIRAFKRETGLTPSEFRNRRCRVGRRMLTFGIFAPAILEETVRKAETTIMEVSYMNGSTHKSDGSCILLGIPKVEYLESSATPFPACLKACLNYMGQDIDYAYLMAASGAAFRLRWQTGFWDGGNVDITYIYENGLEAFERSFQAAGRKYRFLNRAQADKEAFKAFIKKEIDEGRPVIATGVIGPPEACIVAGYRENGDVLLGWNFFQDRPEYAGDTTINENGYFISSDWWENKDTQLLMSIGEEESPRGSDLSLLKNALTILTKEEIRFPGCAGVVAGAQAAYRCWAEKIGDDSEFPRTILMPLLMERYMCLSDAQCMVGEGRYYAAKYLESVGIRHPELLELCSKASDSFLKTSHTAYYEISKALGEHKVFENRVKKLLEPDIRRQIVHLIGKAKEQEAAARGYVAEIVSKLS
jgi:AraC-like DNA-binding protein